MDDILKRLAALERNQNSGQRRAFNVRVNGEEHSATSRNGTANILFPIDGQGMTFSECMFKLIFNDGIKGTPSPNENYCDNWEKGHLLYPTLESWKARYPLGSGVNVDCAYGITCWDYACAFWWAQVHRTLSTGIEFSDGTTTPGKGMAWGTMTPVMRPINQAIEFEYISEWTRIQPGDWVVWGNYGTGHIAMAMSCAPYEWSKITFWQQSGDGSDAGKTVFSQEMGKTVASGIAGAVNTFQGAYRLKNWYKGSC